MNKYSTYIPKAFDLTTLNELIAEAHTQHSNHFCLYEPQTQFFRSYDQYIKDGYVRDDQQAVLAMPSGSEVWLQVHLIKPKRVISKELEQIAVDTEALYRTEIKADQQKALAAMQRRLIAESEEKRAREEAAQRSQIEAEALAEAAQILGLTDVSKV